MAIHRYDECPNCGLILQAGQPHDCPNASVGDKSAGASALHYDQGKAPLDRIPLDMLEDLAWHFFKGETKYDVDNYRLGNFRHGALAASILRHLARIKKGEWYDVCENDTANCNTKGEGGSCNSHTGTPHAVAIAWNALILNYMQRNGLGNDDYTARFVPGPGGKGKTNDNRGEDRELREQWASEGGKTQPGPRRGTGDSNPASTSGVDADATAMP